MKLAKRQQEALRRLNGEFVPGAKMTLPQTMRALQARGLVRYGMNVTMGWQLTAAGKVEAEKLRGGEQS